MPNSIHVATILSMSEPETSTRITGSCDNSYYCRDEWIGNLSEALREDLSCHDGYRHHSEVDVILLANEMLPTMTTTCVSTIRLVADKDMAIRLANEIFERYRAVNPLGTVEYEEIYCHLLGGYVPAITFRGNQFSLASAWWFILVERLRALTGGSSILEVLQLSVDCDDDQWYDIDDRFEHIDLWNDGQANEPDPRRWLALRSGPLYVLDHELNPSEAEEPVIQQAQTTTVTWTNFNWMCDWHTLIQEQG